MMSTSHAKSHFLLSKRRYAIKFALVDGFILETVDSVGAAVDSKTNGASVPRKAAMRKDPCEEAIRRKVLWNSMLVVNWERKKIASARFA